MRDSLGSIGPVLTRGSELLKRELAKRGLSYAEAGTMLGVGSSVITRWVNGWRRPTVRFALLMQKLWDVPIATWDSSPLARTGT